MPAATDLAAMSCRFVIAARIAMLLRGLVFALIGGAAVAATPFALRDADGTGVELWPHVLMLSDPTHTLDEHAVLARAAGFGVPETPHANLGPRTDTVWLRVPLVVPSTERGRWVLDIDYASLDEVDVFVVVDGRPRRAHRLGDTLPFAERPLPTHSHAAVLALERGVEQELLLRVRTTSSMIVPLRLVAEARFLADQSRVQMMQGLLAGIGLCLAAYAFLHTWTLRSAMFLYYALSAVATTLFFYALYGLAPQHLWPGSAWLTLNAAPLLVLVAVFAGVRFVGAALQVHELSRWLHGAQTLVWGAAAASALAFAVGLVGYRFAHVAGTVLGVACMLVTLPAALMRARRGDRAAWAVLAGWAVYAAGAFTMALLLRGKLPFNFWTEYAFQAGSVAEMVSWLLVLSLRMQDERRQAERSVSERDAMRSLAETDALTGLPNRRGLRQRLEGSLPGCEPGRLGAVYMVDLDGFKAVNDRLGHDAGDLLLKAVAARLRRKVRAGDTVARLGGDEFVVCADALPSAEEARRLGDKLVEAMREPFQINGHECRVGLTAGYALAPLDGADADALLKLADAALYAGKGAGKGRVLGAHQMRADSEGFRPSSVNATSV